MGPVWIPDPAPGEERTLPRPQQTAVMSELVVLLQGPFEQEPGDVSLHSQAESEARAPASALCKSFYPPAANAWDVSKGPVSAAAAGNAERNRPS